MDETQKRHLDEFFASRPQDDVIKRMDEQDAQRVQVLRLLGRLLSEVETSPNAKGSDAQLASEYRLWQSHAWDTFRELQHLIGLRGLNLPERYSDALYDALCVK